MTFDIDSFTLELGRASEIGMAAVLATMMFAVALGLKVEHFRFFYTAPRLYLGGVTAQVLGLPLLTLLLCFLVDPQASVALGMILVACCPGGNVSNLLVHLARGNTALSVSLTATTSVFAAFISPIAILFWCSLYPPTQKLLGEIDFDTGRFLLQTAIILALPLVLGMLVGRHLPRLAAVLQRPLVMISSLGLLLIIVTALWRSAEAFMQIGVFFLLLVVVHNALAFLLGYTTARWLKADAAATRALTFEVGIQNSGLGIVILLTQLGGLGGAAAVAGLWGTWHIIAGLVLVWLFRRV